MTARRPTAPASATALSASSAPPGLANIQARGSRTLTLTTSAHPSAKATVASSTGPRLDRTRPAAGSASIGPTSGWRWARRALAARSATVDGVTR